MRWNGFRAAISLTFDDGLPCQIEHALPELNKRAIPATFFLIQNSTYDSMFRKQVWQEACSIGHEVGAHSVNHLKPADLNEKSNRFEVRECKGFLERELQINVSSYCYPYTDVNAIVKDEAKRHYKQARGGRVARKNKFITPGDGADLYNLPALHINGGMADDVQVWADAAIERGAWLILMLHAVGDPNGWDNIDRKPFGEMLDDLRRRDIWLAPMGTVADALRANQ